MTGFLVDPLEMKVLVFEDNLIWSSRLLKSLRALGHEPVLLSAVPEELGGATVAIVNLGSPSLKPGEIVPILVGQGVHVVGHAGHKEKELHALGKAAGCQTLASNSEITFKIEALLNRVGAS